MKNLRVFFCVLLIGLVCVPLLTAKEPEKLCIISFEVVRSHDGKPVRNAAVVIHPVDKHGKQRPNGAELKTDAEGKASYPGIPYGKFRVQVIAEGFQTYGEDFVIKEETRDIKIKIRRPQEQYSIYTDHKDEKKK